MFLKCLKFIEIKNHKVFIYSLLVENKDKIKDFIISQIKYSNETKRN